MAEVLKIKDITSYLESLAPKAYQESYDNSGLLTGDPETVVTGILVTLDCIESIIEEAAQKNCNLIVAHHPIIFKGLKKLTGSNYVERTVLSAIRKNIAIYAIHTNLDHVHTGVNKKICEKIGLTNVRILSPKTDTLSKLVTFIPKNETEKVMAAIHAAGAGQIGKYENCSFRVAGTGTFMPSEGSNPHLGEKGKQEYVDENRVEVIFPTHLERKILEAMKQAHPYEEVAYYLSRVENENQEVGAGMIGELDQAMEPSAFLKRLKISMSLSVIRHTKIPDKPVKKVAVCGGSGSFLLTKAIQQKADVFVTADFKYHYFFDADGRLIIADIGHYESEAYTKELIKEILTKKFPTFAVNFSITDTNPISYLS
ncbi:MAG: Nif3-like dinuclear metal center hexameric protein [Flammeovirgaceae bacterium]|nr:Nif3-like dinuclear metal center hexameric protein [Flammeovirgaceae bacterium]